METLEALRQRIERESEKAIELLREFGLHGRWTCNSQAQKS